MCTTTSNTWAEAWKFQIRPRILEVPCSGVPLGSLAPFWKSCRLWEMNSRVWKSKRVEEISRDFHDLPSMFAIKLDCQLVQVLMVFSCSFPLFEYELVAGWLFEFISISVTVWDFWFDIRFKGLRLWAGRRPKGGGKRADFSPMLAVCCPRSDLF